MAANRVRARLARRIQSTCMGWQGQKRITLLVPVPPSAVGGVEVRTLLVPRFCTKGRYRCLESKQG
jgi:hypothetical protein